MTTLNKWVATAFCCTLVAVQAHSTPLSLLPRESQIEFTVKEMGVPVSGKFERFDASIDIDPVKPEKSNALIRIDIGSLTTGNDEADLIATGTDWLDKARAQYAVFKSTSIKSIGAGRYEARGILSIRNKERDLVIPFTSSEQAQGKILISSDFVIARSEFGIGGGVWNQAGVVSESIPVKVRFVIRSPLASGGR